MSENEARSGGQSILTGRARKLVGKVPPMAWGLLVAVTLVYFVGFATTFSNWQSENAILGAQNLELDIFFRLRNDSYNTFLLYGSSIEGLIFNWIVALALTSLAFWAVSSGQLAQRFKMIGLKIVYITIGSIGMISLVIATKLDTAPGGTHNIGLMQVQTLWSHFASVCLLISAILFVGSHLGKKLDRLGVDRQP